MILVTGAAGKTGRAVVRRLVAREQPVRALVYRQDQVQSFTRVGVADVVVVLDAATRSSVPRTERIDSLLPMISVTRDERFECRAYSARSVRSLI